MLHIGITERGDAGLDLNWLRKINTASVDGAVLITKNLTPVFCNAVLQLYQQNFPLIIHATCTGWGDSIMEPNVPVYTEQLDHLMKLIDSGFPADHCVVRIDPIIPTDEGLQRLRNVLNTMDFYSQYFKDMRIRISIIDEYQHVKQRLLDAGMNTIYPGKIGFPDWTTCLKVSNVLKQYPYTFESCAEPYLSGINIESVGCISERDLRIMGFSDEQINETQTQSFQRRYCKCLNCKTELLTQKYRCPHKCLYCYWKDKT